MSDARKISAVEAGKRKMDEMKDRRDVFVTRRAGRTRTSRDGSPTSKSGSRSASDGRNRASGGRNSLRIVSAVGRPAC